MPNDIDRLQGAWAVTSLEVDGQSMPDSSLAAAQIEIQGDRFTTTGMGAEYAGTLKLDAKPKPRHIDMHFDTGHAAGVVNRGIYELKADAWKLCLATRGDARPSSFATQPGSGFALETLSRATAKTPRKKAKAATAAAEPHTSADATEIEGDWAMVSGVMNGIAMEASMVSWVKRENRGNLSTVLAGPQTMLKVTFTLDVSQSPHAIDYVTLAGPHKGKTQLGIYSLKRDLLSVCMAPPGAARPDEFQSAKGDDRVFTVWKKA